MDAAEALFAVGGYDGVSIREIMRSAGVELGNAAYYFGKKEELLRQVVARRADEIVRDSVGRLNEVIRECQAERRHECLENLIKALIDPLVERVRFGGEGWKSYIRLISSLISIDKDQTYLKSVHEFMDPTINTFIDGIRKIYPESNVKKIYLFYYFLNGYCLHMFQETKSIDITSNKVLSTVDYEYIMNYLPAFFAAGFREVLES